MQSQQASYWSKVGWPMTSSLVSIVRQYQLVRPNNKSTTRANLLCGSGLCFLYFTLHALNQDAQQRIADGIRKQSGNLLANFSTSPQPVSLHKSTNVNALTSLLYRPCRKNPSSALPTRSHIPRTRILISRIREPSTLVAALIKAACRLLARHGFP